MSMTMSSTAPSSKPHRIAIIGGGIAGLSCARRITEQTSPATVQVTVFDTGRLRPGGRASSRLPGDSIKEGMPDPNYTYLNQCIIDHAAQIISSSSGNNGNSMTEFSKQLEQWQQQGVIQEFPNESLSNIAPPLDSNKKTDDKEQQDKEKETETAFRLQPFLPKQQSTATSTSATPTFFHGTQGNGAIPLAMADTTDFEIVQDCWVSPGNGARYVTNNNNKAGQWKLQASGKVLGYFDQLIIAHNGKCADRLMSKTPAKDIHQLLRVNFANSCPAWGGQRMTLNSLYSLTFVTSAKASSSLEQALPEPFIAGFVQNEPNLRFLSCASRKYPNQVLQRDNVQVWTLLSSPTFAKQHKAPQEFIPTETAEEVTTLLLQALERALGLEPDSIQTVESKLQLWGAAVPLNIWESTAANEQQQKQQGQKALSSSAGFLYDGQYSVGVCGDWLVESSVAGAWTSGYRLANHIVSSTLPSSLASRKAAPGATSVGLQGQFVRSNAVHRGGIASFGEDKKKKQNASKSRNNNNSNRTGNNATRRNSNRSRNRQNTKSRNNGNRQNNGGQRNNHPNQNRPQSNDTSNKNNGTKKEANAESAQTKPRVYASISSD